MMTAVWRIETESKVGSSVESDKSKESESYWIVVQRDTLGVV